MTVFVARMISVLLHPFILSAIATLISADLHQASPLLFQLLIFILITLGAIALGFAWWHVRAGRWQHIDAVAPAERKVLNMFLTLLLLISSGLAWKYFPQPELAYGLLISGIAIVAAMLISPWLKVSLHSCFAAVAAGIVYPTFNAIAIGVGISVLVYWARFVLKRHNMLELLAGSVIGIGCAMLYQVMA